MRTNLTRTESDTLFIIMTEDETNTATRKRCYIINEKDCSVDLGRTRAALLSHLHHVGLGVGVEHNEHTTRLHVSRRSLKVSEYSLSRRVALLEPERILDGGISQVRLASPQHQGRRRCVLCHT